ncbi:MAG TPA: O-acetyl-ADP-ribose deacetylase [Terriglobales bacterium]|jgi:O-acetyl-ADP-ribose deacetylase (regulator of RNase III)|nr:O-acetyl-ADP-ribose deacetylase [Terriglobales bacterium]
MADENTFRVIVPPGKTILLLRGDITRAKTDAIVNAANSSLLGGGGVDGAIHRAGGPAILEECKNIRNAQGSLPTGKAVATTGGKLNARHVIHTVGPVWNGGSRNEAELLQSCYRESLMLAEKLALRTVSFPSISTGAFGYPVEKAAVVALSAVTEVLAHLNSVSEAHFVLFDGDSFAAYREAASALLASGKFPRIGIDNDTHE